MESINNLLKNLKHSLGKVLRGNNSQMASHSLTYLCTFIRKLRANSGKVPRHPD